MGRNNADLNTGIIQARNVGKRVYRGIHAFDGENPSEPNLDRNVGVHWTTNRKIAARFAQGIHPEEDEFMGGDENSTGHILEGYVHHSQVERDPEALADYDLGNSAEREVPVKRGGYVNIHTIHTTAYDPESGLPKITGSRKIDPPWTAIA